MTKLKLKDATKELLADATKVKDDASRARKGAENLLQSLRAIENGFVKANEEKDAEMKRAEAEKQRADHSKAYVMLDAEERAAIEAAEKEAARAKAAAEKAAAEKAAAEAAAAAAAKHAALAKEHSDNVFFLLDSSVIRKSEAEKITAIAEWMKANPEFKITIVGYADEETGKPASNLRLSERRVNNVKAALIKAGVAENLITTDFKGDTVRPFDVQEQNRVVICTLE